MRGTAALWTGSVDELRHQCQGRTAGERNLHIVGQQDGQVFLGHGHCAIVGAVDHGNRRTPIALAADAPIAQLVGDGGFTEAVFLGVLRHLRDRFLAGQAAKFAGVDQQAVGLGEGQYRVAGVAVGRIAFATRHDDHTNVEPIFLRELVIALVVRGNRHDRASAVAHEHVIRYPDRDLLIVVRIDGEASGVHAMLLDGTNVIFFFRLALLSQHLVDFVAQVRMGSDEVGNNRMLRRQLQRGGAVNGVDARSEHRDFVACRASFAVEGEVDQRAFAATDPVALLREDALGPSRHLVETVEQLVGVLGDAEEPLLQLALLDQRVFMTPATTVRQHLFVGQNRCAFRTPVHLGILAIGQPLLEQLQEEPLVPAVIFGLAGGELFRPVVGEAEPLHLRLHGGDVVHRPLTRRRVVLDGSVLGR